MNILIADFGSYSLKIARFRVDRQGLTLLEFFEELTPAIKPLAELPKTGSSEQEGENKPAPVSDRIYFHHHHLEILKNLMDDGQNKDKTVFIVPDFYLSFRNLSLPIKSQKKAELMVPHQLEESVPYSIENLHLLKKFEKSSTGLDVLVEYITHKDMANLYGPLKNNGVLPNLFTSLTMLQQEFVKWFTEQSEESASTAEFEQKIWSIIDVGHTTTKVTIYRGRNLINKHTIAFGGKNFEQAIARAYKISDVDAHNYKHQNAFFLTESQLQTASKDENVFAQVMKEEALNLVFELRRFLVSVKVKQGYQVNFIYWTGGGARVPNFLNFMGEKIELPCSELPLAEFFISKGRKFEGGQLASYGQAIIGALAHVKGATLPNLLRGDYSTSHQEIIPLQSTAYLTTRTLILSLILCFGLLVEKIFLFADEKQVNTFVASVLKNPQLGLNSKEERTYKTRPDRLTPVLAKKEKAIAQEVSELSAAKKINAVKALSDISKVLNGNQKVDVSLFENIDGMAKVIIKSTESLELKRVADYVETTTLKIASKNLSKDGLTLTLVFDGT